LGYDDETDNLVNEINLKNEQKLIEDENKRLETIRLMEQNRNNAKDELEKIQALAKVLGIDKITERLDELNKNDNYLVGKMTELVNSINGISMQEPAAPQAQTNEINKLQLLGQLLESPIGKALADKFLSPPQIQNQIIDPEYINEKVRSSIMGNFEVGEALIGQLKNKIIGKAITKTVSSILDSNEPA